MRDRVVQMAAKLVLEPIFEADFLPCSFGFRPKRPATQAVERLRVAFIEGCHFVAESGIRSFFGEISHVRLLAEVGRLLREEYGAASVTARTKLAFAQPVPEDMLKELVSDCDVVVTGVGDCGRSP